MKTYRLEITIAAQEDLQRLHDFLCDQDALVAERAIEAIQKAYEFLKFMPESCRRAGWQPDGNVYREMIVRFGRSGYLVLFEIQADETVSVIAVKHQRETDHR
jgi:plasmid stabilization system protein ParE